MSGPGLWCPLSSLTIMATYSVEETVNIDRVLKSSSYSSLSDVVKDYIQAVNHINEYGSKHSDSIIASDSSAVKYFMQFVDSAAVYHNCSTAFTDGFEFGLGAEMGISTQKLHARGPLGLRELTSIKYCIYGSGQTRK